MVFEDITFKDAYALYQMFIVEHRFFIYSLGLFSTHEDCWWLHVDKQISYLKISDKKRWLFSKLKYGI
jgi:hypothetical protein